VTHFLRKTLFSVVAFTMAFVVNAPPPAQAESLWHQRPSGFGLTNQEFSDGASYSTYAVNDISVGGGGWQINAISETYGRGISTPSSGTWPAIFSAILNIFPKSAPLPLADNDPTAGTVYDATLTADPVNIGNSIVTLGGLNIALAPGEYWIGFTPLLDYGSYGQHFQLTANNWGDPPGFRNPGGGFGYGTAWMTSDSFGFASADLNIQIEGAAVPEIDPNSLGSVLALVLGSLGLLERRRLKAA